MRMVLALLLVLAAACSDEAPPDSSAESLELVVHCTRDTLEGIVSGSGGSLSWRKSRVDEWEDIPLDEDGTGRTSINGTYQIELRFVSPVGAVAYTRLPVGSGLGDIRTPGVERSDGLATVHIEVAEYATVHVRLSPNATDREAYFAVVSLAPSSPQIGKERLASATPFASTFLGGIQEAEVRFASGVDGWIGVYTAEGRLVADDPAEYHLETGEQRGVLMGMPVNDE